MRARLLLSASLMALLGCGAAAATTPEQLAARLDVIRQNNGIPSAAIVLVNRDGTLLARSYGVINLQSRQPVTPKTLFRVGSITKTFTALAALRMQAKGQLKLDQPVRQLTPEASYDNAWESTKPLTLENLLEHTAGWSDLSPLEFNSSDSKPLTIEEALALRPASRTSLWAPGLYQEYSNGGAGLVSYVMEQRGGQSFENLMRREVFEPLGMGSASLLGDSATRANLAQGYDEDGHTPLPYWHMLYRAAAGLNLMPADMAPLLRMLLNQGSIGGRGGKSYLSAQDVERLEHPRTTLMAHAGWTRGYYGLGVRSYDHRGHPLFGHGGDADGYLSQFSYSRESGLGFFIVISAFNNQAIEAMQALAEDWLIESLPPATAAAVALPPQVLTSLEGDYFTTTARFPQPAWQKRKLRVKSAGEGLTVRDDDNADHDLVAVDAQRFRDPDELSPSWMFLRQNDGTVVLQSPSGNWLRPATRGLAGE